MKRLLPIVLTSTIIKPPIKASGTKNGKDVKEENHEFLIPKERFE